MCYLCPRLVKTLRLIIFNFFSVLIEMHICLIIASKLVRSISSRYRNPIIITRKYINNSIEVGNPFPIKNNNDEIIIIPIIVLLINDDDPISARFSIRSISSTFNFFPVINFLPTWLINSSSYPDQAIFCQPINNIIGNIIPEQRKNNIPIIAISIESQKFITFITPNNPKNIPMNIEKG